MTEWNCHSKSSKWIALAGNSYLISLLPLRFFQKPIMNWTFSLRKTINNEEPVLSEEIIKYIIHCTKHKIKFNKL